MNYEEMLGAREGTSIQKESMIFGNFYKKLIDKKYRNVVELKMDLVDNFTFCERLKKDCELCNQIIDSSQLHYEIHEDNSGIYEIELELGNYQTYSQLLEVYPAVVAGNNYIDDTLTSLAEVTTKLNEQGVYQLCYAPQMMLARKSDNAPVLIWHGSFYKGIGSMDSVFQSCEEMVAPEVKEEGIADERSDVYALGKFIELLFEKAVMPIEYKYMLKKATNEDPAKRYACVKDMVKAVKKKRRFKKSLLTLLAAVAVALLGIALYIDMMPQPHPVEFVESKAKESLDDDFLDQGIDPEVELGLVRTDSMGNELTPEREQEMAEFEAKAEQIFRKRYTQAAERILSKVYNKERMNQNEQKFLEVSRSANEELVRIQSDLGEEAGLNSAKSQRIASEIIETVGNRLKKEVGMGLGYQRPQKAGNDE